MLLDGHHLDGIVAVGLDARQHLVLKFAVGAHLLGILSHTYVTLIDEQRGTVGLEGFLLEHIRMFGIPHLCREYLGLLVLHHALTPGWDALSFAAVPLDLHLIQVTMLNGLFREFEFPVACSLDALALVSRSLLPVVEVAHEEDLRGIGCPFAEYPPFGLFMESEIEVAGGEV